MGFRSFISVFVSALGLILMPGGLHAYGFDTTSAPRLVQLLDHIDNGHGQWIRIRGLPRSMGSPESVKETHSALTTLKRKGFKICGFVQWNPESWPSGVRPGKGNRLPLDLRELYTRTQTLATTYANVVDVWEIHNEPDIGFLDENPETYAAGLKACYLAIKSTALGTGTNPQVIMAPLALPPGSYMELLWLNGSASYTDGLNFHYYGYAQDFTNVVQQFKDAINRTLPSPQIPLIKNSKRISGLERKALPIFITEYGYGLLHKDARLSKDGRIRQWRWFSDVVQQLQQLRIDAGMAFLLVPYLEAPSFIEFGLLANFESGANVKYVPQDFGATREEKWMSRIGEKFAPNLAATPALAYLLSYANEHSFDAPRVLGRFKRPHGNFFRSENNREHKNIASAYPASPVVIDLLASEDFSRLKSVQAHLIKKTNHLIKDEHKVDVVLYNFSEKRISGVLHVSSELPSRFESLTNQHITLGPGARVIVATYIKIPHSPFKAHAWRLCFIPDGANAIPSFLATKFYPDPSLLNTHRVFDFAYSANESRKNSRKLSVRPLANEEPKLVPQGRWLVSKGMQVEEIKTQDNRTLWKFSYAELPDEPLRPAIAELPLPDNFRFDPMDNLSFRYKVTLPPGKSAHPDKSFVGAYMDVYIRTTNGNLYTIQPPTWTSINYRNYTQPLSAFTMGFYGRAHLPWRFFENKPAALVFYFRSRVLPTSYEILDPQLIRWHD